MRAGSAQKSMYLRGIPLQLVRDAKAVAARRGITLAAFVSDALQRAMRDDSLTAHDQLERAARPARAVRSVDEPDDDLSAEMQWFERNRVRLLREFAGRYVAVLDEAVVDHDADFEALAQRVFARHGAHNVFMPLVASAPKPLRVRSPLTKRAR